MARNQIIILDFKSILIKKGLAYLCSVFLVCGLFSASALAQQTRPNALVRVTASDESEKPLAGVEAQLKLNGTVVGTTTTNEKGEAEFVNIAPGTYEVVVAKEGFEPLTQSDIVVTAGAPLE